MLGILLAVQTGVLLLAGAALGIWQPKKEGHKRRWFFLFAGLGAAGLALTILQDAESDRERSADRQLLENQQARIEKLDEKNEALQSRNEALSKKHEALQASNEHVLSRNDVLLSRNDRLLQRNERLVEALREARDTIAEINKTTQRTEAKIDVELPPARKLTDAQTATIVERLRVQPAEVVVRSAVTFESQQYAKQLSSAITKAGWTLGFVRMWVNQQDAPGVFLLVKDSKNPSPAAIALYEALERAGIGVTPLQGIDDSVTLYVGLQSAAARNLNIPNPK